MLEVLILNDTSPMLGKGLREFIAKHLVLSFGRSVGFV